MFFFVFVPLFESVVDAGGAEYQDFLLDPLDGTVSLNRSLEDNELVQPVILVVKVLSFLLVSLAFRRVLVTVTIGLASKGSSSRQLGPLRFDDVDR